MVLSPGDCNCCGEIGKVIFLAALHDGSVFLACNSCGAASRASAYKEHWLADGTQGIEEFAPSGFRPATAGEVASAGYELARMRSLKDEEYDLLRS
jgi:hypothetical protein